MASGTADRRPVDRARALWHSLGAGQTWSGRIIALLSLLTSFVLSFLYMVPAGLILVGMSAVGIPAVQSVGFLAASPTAARDLPLQLLFTAAAFTAAPLVGRLCCRIQRSRLGDTHGLVESTPPDPLRPRSLQGRVLRFVYGPEAWQSVFYSTLAGMQGALAGTFALGMLVYGVGALIGVLGVVMLAPLGYPTLEESSRLITTHMLSIGVGVLGAFVGLWIAPLLVSAEVEIARRVLFDAPEVRVRRRLEQVRTSRSRMVDAADSERRRIERDLHDGAQQRLLAVTMTLTRARAKFDRDPATARALLEEAQSEAKAVMGELRDVARGLHPKVLTDHGLEAALPVAAGRAQLPVKVDVDLDERPSPRAEGAAFYVASEALTNIVKHARAEHAIVSVLRIPAARDKETALLRITISDDGAGGADPDQGTGLYGLWDRVDAVDGELRVHSPDGGGTTLTADIPWEA